LFGRNQKADLSKVILEPCCVFTAISGELKCAKRVILVQECMVELENQSY